MDGAASLNPPLWSYSWLLVPFSTHLKRQIVVGCQTSGVFVASSQVDKRSIATHLHNWLGGAFKGYLLIPLNGGLEHPSRKRVSLRPSRIEAARSAWASDPVPHLPLHVPSRVLWLRPVSEAFWFGSTLFVDESFSRSRKKGHPYSNLSTEGH